MKRLILLAAFATGACSEGPTPLTSGPVPVSITTDRPAYQFGSQATVTVQNVADRSLEYNLCPLAVERFENGGWNVSYPLMRLCTRETQTLPRHGSVTVTEFIEPAWSPGLCRFRYSGFYSEKNDPSNGASQVSNQFTVSP